MKECLNCHKEFQGKTEKKKFCKDSCRVMYNRKNGGKGLRQWQAQNIYNELKETIVKLNDKISSIEMTTYTPHETASPKPVKLRRTFENYQQLRLECINIEDWESLKKEILLADNLTTKQKAMLTT
jgi:hypothetical protein